MILVDTSVWVDHFRHPRTDLLSLLDSLSVVVHPFVIGEIALGNPKNRHGIIRALHSMPLTNIELEHEVLYFIEYNNLFGSGIGYVDAHLLASARLMPETLLWSFDKRLNKAAERLGLAYEPVRLLH